MNGRCHILGESGTSPQQMFPCISTWPAAGSGPHLSPARIPEGKLFRDLGPPIPLDPGYKFLRPPLRPTPPSCVTCLLGPFARGPDVQGLDFPGPPCCPARCVPGSRLHVAPLPGVVSHGPAARPAGLLPVPLRHDCLRSTGERQFPLDWCQSGHSRLLSSRIISRGVRPLPLAFFRAGPSRSTSGLSSRLVSGPFILASSRPGAPAEELGYIQTRQGEHTVILVLASDRSMETTVHATAAVPGRA